MLKYFVKKTYLDEENPYWISFSDAISGILIIFILATVYLIYSIQQRENYLNQQLNHDITNIQHELEKEGIRVEIDKNIMRIPTNEIHFKNNEASIPLDKIYNVRKIGQKVIEYVQKDENKNIDTVFIEGHTDCNPTNRPRGNLGLSTDRAISIAVEWEKLDVNFWNIKNKNGKPLFSVSGYGEKRPIEGTLINGCENETPENLERNRRIDIRFVVGRPKFVSMSSMEDNTNDKIF